MTDTSIAFEVYLLEEPEEVYFNVLEVYPAPIRPKIPLKEYPEEEMLSPELRDSPDHEDDKGICNLNVAADATLPKRKKAIKTKSKERFIELLNEY